jgi:hypothetical protein
MMVVIAHQTVLQQVAAAVLAALETMAQHLLPVVVGLEHCQQSRAHLEQLTQVVVVAVEGLREVSLVDLVDLVEAVLGQVQKIQQELPEQII